MKLLIIGCGDVGQRLAGVLPDEWQVTGVRRHPPAALSGRLKYRALDATQTGTLEPLLAEGFDVVVITMTPSERSDEGYRKAYVQVCNNLVQAAKKAEKPPGLVLFVSSTSVYSGIKDGRWVDESTPAEAADETSRRLLEAEDQLRHSELPHCIVRFTGIYGPGRNRLLDSVRQGRAVLSAAWTNRIHADDCAGVLAHLLERWRQGEALEPLYLATDNKPAPMAEVVAWLATQLNVDQARFAPDEGGLNKRCSNKRLLATGYQFRYPDYQAGYRKVLSGETDL